MLANYGTSELGHSAAINSVPPRPIEYSTTIITLLLTKNNTTILASSISTNSKSMSQTDIHYYHDIESMLRHQTQKRRRDSRSREKDVGTCSNSNSASIPVNKCRNVRMASCCSCGSDLISHESIVPLVRPSLLFSRGERDGIVNSSFFIIYYSNHKI